MNVSLQIESVSTDVVAHSGAEAGRVVLLEVGGEGRRLNIVMGRVEARAIDDARRGHLPPRPLPWDLLRSVIDALGGTLDSVVITEVDEGRLFRSEIVVRRDHEVYRVPARPSDALALAVRWGSSAISAVPEVMDQAGS